MGCTFIVRFALLAGFISQCAVARNVEIFKLEKRMQKEITKRLMLLKEEIIRELTDKFDMRAIPKVLLNDTAELEERVEDLETAMVDVQDDVAELETDVSLIDGRLLNLETDVALINENLINVQTDVSDNEDAIFDLVLDVDTLQETSFVHQEQIAVLQDTDVLFEERISTLESSLNGSIPSNTSDLEIRVTALEEAVSEHSVSITSLQETDTEFEQRIEDLEDYIIGEWTACESSPCGNAATCVDVNVDTFICVCRDGYFGLTCSESFKDTFFLATINANTVSPTDPIVFDDVRINPGGHYDNTTGIYTAPLDGIYEFYAQLESNADENNDWGFQITVDNINVLFTRHDASGSTDSDEKVSSSTTVLLQLSAGQEVFVWTDVDSLYGSSSADLMYSWFSGRLVSAD